MSEETKKTPQAEPAAEPKTAEQAAPEAAAEQAAPASETAEPKDAKKDGWFKKNRDLEAAKAKLEAAEQEAAQTKEKLLRMAAEYDNYRKRTAREADQKFNDGISFAVNQIIPILDTLEMAANAPTTDFLAMAFPPKIKTRAIMIPMIINGIDHSPLRTQTQLRACFFFSFCRSFCNIHHFAVCQLECLLSDVCRYLVF